MKKILFACLIAVVLVSCSKMDSGQKGSGEVYAKVGSANITQADFDREFQTLPDYAQKMFEDEGGRERFLEEIIKKEILYQEALKKNFDKSADFQKKLEEFKKLTLISELFEKEIMTKAKVSDQDVKDFYEKNKQDFATVSQIKASHILVKTEDEAEKILARLSKGDKFEDIAKAASIDKATAKNGGDLGFFSKGQMVPEFESAAGSLKVGETSRPVKTPFGYHIIKVTDKKAGPVVEFDKIKGMIAQKLTADKQKEVFDAYINEVRKGVKVEINKEALAKAQGKAKEEMPKADTEKPQQPKEDVKKEETKAKEETKQKGK